MNGLKICVIGGGSTYTPELIEGLIDRQSELPVSKIVLMDLDEDKLSVVGGLAARMAKERGYAAAIELTTDRRDAIEGADYIITQIRVGGLQARVRDERIPMEFGVIGQETTGAGGFAKAMRTIPVMLDIARDIEDLSPGAWLINFTNPSGIITETLAKHTNVRNIGLCNVPMGMKDNIAKRLGVNADDLFMRYAGLNHLSFVSRVWLHGEDVTLKVLDQAIEAAGPEEADWIREYGVVPSYYLHYYYAMDKVLDEQRKSEKTRAEEVVELERQLLDLYRSPNLKEKPEQLSKRGGAHYSTAAISLISAIYNDKNELHVLNVRNRGAISCLPLESIVEVNCVVNGAGAHPITVGEIPGGLQGLLQAVKNYETLTVRAGVEGSRHQALQALAANPLVPSLKTAKSLLDRILQENETYLPQFGPVDETCRRK